MNQVFIVLMLCLMLMGCEETAGKKDFDRELVRQEAKTTLENYFADIRSEGLSAEFKYLDSSADFFWVPPGYSSALNYDSVRAILEKNAKSFQLVEFKWRSLEIYPLSDHYVNYTGIVDGKLVDTSGVSSLTSMIETGLLVRTKEGWKIRSGQSRNLD